MPIVVECNCGKRFKAQDAHAGKRTKCPACGTELLIPKVAQATAGVVSVAPRKPAAAAPARPAAAAKPQANPLDDDALFDIAEPGPAAPPPRRAPVAAAAAPPPTRPQAQAAAAPAHAPAAAKGPAKNAFGRRNFESRDKEKGPAINIGGGIVTWTIVALIVVGGIIFLVKQGPVKATKEWETLGPQGESDVLTIVTRGVRGWYAAKGYFDDDFRKAPHCDHMFYDEPLMMWSVPTVIEFQGHSSEGKIYGKYWPAKREVECDAKFDTEGITVKITGRHKDGQWEVEIDGKPAPELKPSGRPPRDDY